MTAKDAKQTGDKPAPAPRTKSSGSFDAAAIRELAELLTETSLTEIEVEQNGLRIRVCRQATPGLRRRRPAPRRAGACRRRRRARAQARGPCRPAPSPRRWSARSMSRRTPGAPPFVKVGDTVNEGDTLLIVEAMKTMNPILAPRSGTVKEICIQDAEPVEFGQALIVLG